MLCVVPVTKIMQSCAHFIPKPKLHLNEQWIHDLILAEFLQRVHYAGPTCFILRHYINERLDQDCTKKNSLHLISQKERKKGFLYQPFSPYTFCCEAMRNVYSSTTSIFIISL